MLSRFNSLIFLATTLLVTLQSQSSFAVKINNPYGRPIIKTFEDPITQTAGLVQLQAWPFYDPRSFLDFGKVVEVKPGGTDKLVSLLRSGWREPEWEFVRLGGLDGSFNIKEYNPCTPVFGEFCGGRLDRYGGVGSYFRINYNPEGDDPRGNSVHWIQRVINNYNGFEIDEIDKPIWQLENPYYDTNATASPNYFLDIPYILPPPNKRTYFYAEVYLVDEIKNSVNQQKTVNIYDGVRWGWEYIPANTFKKYSGTLLSGIQNDRYTIENLLPGSKFYAYTNNDLPGNRCNPNTYLNTYGNYDDNSSPVGNGFASALTGTVSSNGTINLDVSTPEGGRRGEDRGNYELNVMVFGEENFSDEQFQQFPAGSSGGGGFQQFPAVSTAGSSGGGGFGNELRGRTQDDPILSHATEGSWQVFRNAPGCRWYDPHTPYGFEFQALDDTLFTEILDFPVGPDNQFTVSVGDRILGEFGAGDSVDFTSLFGSGISNFKITGIDSLLGSTEETAFPIQLAFNDRYGSFKMRPFSQESSPQSVPESTSALGLLALLSWGIIKAMKIRLEK